jgi:hypothetical protein
MDDDKAKQILKHVKEQYVTGKLNQQVFLPLIKLYSSMKHKLTKNLKLSIKRDTKANIIEALYLLYIYLFFTDDENV